MSTRIEQGGSDFSPKKKPTENQPVEREKDLSVFMSDDDKKLTREVDGKDRTIRVGHDGQGDKFRYTDDTKEELVATSTTGKNKYLTKSAFEQQIKDMLHIDYLPESIRAEYRDGNIIFIDNNTNETLTANELRQNPEIIALQERKVKDAYFAEQDAQYMEELRNTSVVHDQIKLDDFANLDDVQEDLIRIHEEINEKYKAETMAQYQKEQEALAEKYTSTFKVDPNWYTPEGVSILQRDWSKYASAKQGFTREFYQGIVDIAKEIHCDPDHIMTVIQSESGFNPAAKNKYSNASGLVQIMPEYAPLFGKTPAGIRAMSPIEQLPLIRHCFVEGRDVILGKDSQHPMSGGMVYGAIYLPGGTRDALKADGVLSRAGHKYYNQNPRLDYDKDRKITIDDLDTLVSMTNHGSRAQEEYFIPDPLNEIVVVGKAKPKPTDEEIAKGKPTEVPGENKITEGEQPKPVTPQDTQRQGNTHTT